MPPPSTARMSMKIVIHGTMTSMAINTGVTRWCIGLMPITRSASISCEICIVPSCAVTADAERPAIRNAVISGPNSRNIVTAIAAATRDCAPKSWRLKTAWIESMMPEESAMTAATGAARTPILIISDTTATRHTGLRQHGSATNQYPHSTNNTNARPTNATPATALRPNCSVACRSAIPGVSVGTVQVIFHRSMDRKNPIEACQPEHVHRRRAYSDKGEQSILLTGGLIALDQARHAGAIDIVYGSEIHQHGVFTGDAAQNGPSGVRRTVQIHIPGEHHHGDVAVPCYCVIQTPSPCVTAGQSDNSIIDHLPPFFTSLLSNFSWCWRAS